MTVIRIIDTETCGFPPDNGQIVEIATLDLVNEEGEWKRGRSWSSLVNPGRPIPPEASAIHHITDDMVKDAPAFANLPIVGTLSQPDVPLFWCAHEARFEKTVLPKGLVDTAPWLCTRKLSAVLWPDAPNHKNQTMRYYLKLKLADPSLAEPHRAAGDAYVTGALMRRILSLPNASLDEFLEASNNPVLLPKFNFGQHAMKPMSEVPTSYLEWLVNKSNFDDEDVIFTAKHYLHERRSAQRSRSPV